MKMIEFTML